MKKIIITCLSVFSFLLMSCFEQSTVVKIKDDGSGIIHTRAYTNVDAGMGALGGMLGEDTSGDSGAEEAATEIPGEEELKELAKSMGEGVTFKSVKESKNASGWSGYEVIYEFSDVNKIKVSMDNDLQEKMGDMAPEEEEKEAEFVTFNKDGKKLSINIPFPEQEAPAGNEEAENGETDNPFGESADPMDGMAGMMGMMGPMLQGARMGVFVQIEDGIAETNAKHTKGNLITIFNANLGKIFSNAEAMGKMQKMEDVSREDAQKIADEMDGIDVDLQEEIKVTIK